MTMGIITTVFCSCDGPGDRACGEGESNGGSHGIMTKTEAKKTYREMRDYLGRQRWVHTKDGKDYCPSCAKARGLVVGGDV